MPKLNKLNPMWVVLIASLTIYFLSCTTNTTTNKTTIITDSCCNCSDKKDTLIINTTVVKKVVIKKVKYIRDTVHQIHFPSDTLKLDSNKRYYRNGIIKL